MWPIWLQKTMRCFTKFLIDLSTLCVLIVVLSVIIYESFYAHTHWLYSMEHHHLLYRDITLNIKFSMLRYCHVAKKVQDNVPFFYQRITNTCKWMVSPYELAWMVSALVRIFFWNDPLLFLIFTTYSGSITCFKIKWTRFDS